VLSLAALIACSSAIAGQIVHPDKPVLHEQKIAVPTRDRISPIDFHEIASDQITDFATRSPEDGLAKLETTASAAPGITPQMSAGQVSAWALAEIVRGGGSEQLSKDPVLRARLIERLGGENVSFAQAAGRHVPHASTADLAAVADRLDEFFAQCVRDPLAPKDPDERLVISPDRRSDLLLPNLLAEREAPRKP